jgi:serine/threonine protein phosphatase PrpC
MKGLFEETFRSITNSVKIGISNDCNMENFTSSFGEVFFLIDGMGESKEVNKSFRLAASAIKKHIILNPNQTLNPNQIINESIKSANNSLEYVNKKNSVHRGIGSVFLLIISKNWVVYYSYCGNSILYLIRGNSIYNLTEIQSSEKELDCEGNLNYDENDGLKTYKDDKFLLCSYRMTEVLDSQKLYNIVNDLQPKQACEELLDLANIVGCKDYISAQIFHIFKSNLLLDDLRDMKSGGVFEKGKIIEEEKATNEPIEDIKKTNFKEDIQEYIDERKGRKFFPIYLRISGIMVIIILILAIVEFDIFNSNKTLMKNIQTPKENKAFTQVQNDIDMAEQLRRFLKELFVGENPINDFDSKKIVLNILIEKLIYKDLKSNTTSNNDIKMLTKDIRDNNLKFKELKKINDDDQDYYNADLIMTENGNIKTYSISLVEEDNKYMISKIMLKHDLIRFKPLEKKGYSEVNYSFKNNEGYNENDEELLKDKYVEKKIESNYSKRIILNDKVLK